MVSLRKFFLSAAALTLVSSAAFAAAPATTVGCTVVNSTDVLRAEGKTEKLSDITYTCQAANVGALNTAFTFQLFTTGGVPVTSQDASVDGTHHATLTVQGGLGPNNGSVAGNSVTWPAVTLPTAATDSFTITISGVLLDASQVPTGGTVGLNVLAASSNTAQVPSTIFGGTATVGVSPLSQLQNVAVSLKSLSVKNEFGAYETDSNGKYVKLTTCEMTTGFKPSDGTKAAQNIITKVSFTGVLSTSFPIGQRLTFTIANLPAGVTLYVPNKIGAGANVANLMVGYGATLSGGYQWDATGSTDMYSPVSASGTVVYQMTASSLTVGTVMEADVVAQVSDPVAAALPTSIVAGYAPTGTVAIPRFIDPTSVATDIIHVGDCNTTLYYPYVVVGGGYDTGIAVANSGSDVTDPTSALDGVCTFTFYGLNAPTTTTLLTVKAGQTNAFDLLTAYPTGNFSGYGVAKCNFQKGHGYTYIANQQGGTASYLPAEE